MPRVSGPSPRPGALLRQMQPIAGAAMSASGKSAWTCPGCLQSYWTEAPFTGPWNQWIKCWGCGAVYSSDRPDGTGRTPKVHQPPKSKPRPKPAPGEMGKSARRLLAVA